MSTPHIEPRPRWRNRAIALFLCARHGEVEAEALAARRADEMLCRGNRKKHDAWLRVMWAVRELRGDHFF